MNHWSKIEAVVSVDTECFIPGPVEGQGGKKEGEEGEEESKKMVHAQARVSRRDPGRAAGEEGKGE